MSVRRINPETGVFEEQASDFSPKWTAVKNEGGLEERINPKTGVHEEQATQFGPWFVPKNK